MPLCKESHRMKVAPCRFSRSNETDSTLHMWKKVLYWIVASPGWFRYLQ